MKIHYLNKSKKPKVGDSRVTSYRRNIERNYPEWLS